MQSHQAKLNKLSPLKVHNSKSCGFFCADRRKRLVARGVFSLIFVLFCNYKAFALQASYYSIQSLHRDRQWEITKGRCANGENFADDKLTCATWLFPLGSILRITNTQNSQSVIVKVTDRINRRFAKTRVDLSKGAFAKIADCRQGVVSIKIMRIR
jgi:rare lipoprotein A (peptidoglycan hydrolase)